MGLFDSKSKTSSTASPVSVGNYGDGPTQTFAGVNAGKNSHLTITTGDYGALDAAKQIAAGGYGLGQNAIEAVSNSAKSVIDKTLSIAAKTQVSESAQFQDTLLKLGLVIAVAVAAVAFFKRKG